MLVGQHLRQAGAAVLVDGFLPTPDEAGVDEARSDILALAGDASLVRSRAAEHDAAIAAIDQAAAAAARQAGAAGGVDQAADADAGVDDAAAAGARGAHEQARAACSTAVGLYDALFASLSTDVGGMSFLERALRERVLRKRLENAAVVSLKVDGSWATHVVRKNLFSGLFGRLPIQVSATVGVSWAAYRAATGEFLGGGVETAMSNLADLAAIKRDGRR